MFGKRVVVTIHGIDWQREKWKSGFGSKFIRQGEKNAVKYADEIVVLSKGVQDYFKDTYGRETRFIPNGVNRPEIQSAKLITEKFDLTKDSYILFLGRLVPEKGLRYLIEAFKAVKTNKKLVIAGGSSDTDSFMKRAVLIPLRRIDGEPCLTDELLQCLAFLEANILDVLNTIYRLFQRTGAGEDELHIRQLLTDLNECADSLFLREAAEVEDVILLRRLFPLHLIDEVVHCHGLRCKQRVAVHLALHELRAADHGVNVLIGALPLPELGFHHANG